MPSPETIFQLGNTIALGGWIALIFLPRRWGIVWIPQFVIPSLLAFAYAALILPIFFAGGEGGFDSIENVRALFQNDAALTAGWLHYLAFDLFVGSWIAKASDKAGIPRPIQAVFLLGTFMFGPIGFLLFILTRSLMAGLVERPTMRRGRTLQFIPFAGWLADRVAPGGARIAVLLTTIALSAIATMLFVLPLRGIAPLGFLDGLF